MKQSSKSSTSMGGDFDEEVQSGRHVHIYNNCNIHNYHFHNEANGEEQKPLKQAAPVNATPSITDEEQKLVGKISPTQARPINDSPKEKPYVRIQSGADTNYFLSVRDGKLIAALFDFDDESQHWYLQRIKIKLGHDHAFLVNKSAGKALKYSDEDNSLVQLVTYNPQVLYRSTLWTNLSSCWLSPLDYPQYALEVNFSSGGASCDGYPVFINRTATIGVFMSNTNSNSKTWEIIDYLKPVVLA